MRGLGVGAVAGVGLAVVLLFGSSPSMVDSISVWFGNECSGTMFSVLVVHVLLFRSPVMHRPSVSSGVSVHCRGHSGRASCSGLRGSTVGWATDEQQVSNE